MAAKKSGKVSGVNQCADCGRQLRVEGVPHFPLICWSCLKKIDWLLGPQALLQPLLFCLKMLLHVCYVIPLSTIAFPHPYLAVGFSHVTSLHILVCLNFPLLDKTCFETKDPVAEWTLLISYVF